MLVATASTAYNTLQGVGDISELKEYVLSGIGSSANQVHNGLPSFEMMLVQTSCMQMNEQIASEIASLLRQSDILKDNMQVDMQKIGAIPSIASLNSSTSLSSNQNSAPLQQVSTQDWEKQSLVNQESVNLQEEHQTVIQASEHSSVSNKGQKELPGGDKYRLQTSGLLMQLDQTNHKNYDGEIDQIASNISGVVSARMKGLIKSGIISPVTGQVVSASLEYVLDKTALRDIIQSKIDGPEISGVAAGDGYGDGCESESDEEDARPQKVGKRPDNGLSATGGELVKGISFNDPRALSDEALHREYNKNAATLLKPDFMLTDRERLVRSEFEKRFNEKNPERQTFAAGSQLPPLMRMGIEKVAGVNFGIDDDPTELVSRVANNSKILASKKLHAKDHPALSDNVIDGKNKAESSKPLNVLDITEVKALGTKEIIERNTGVVKPLPTKNQQKYLTNLQGFDSWDNASKYVKKVPEEFGVPKYNDKGVGFRWETKDANGVHNIRIDKGNPAAKYATEHVDHVAISYNGRVIDKTGKNYILKDDVTGATYKIGRAKVDKNIIGIEHGFDVSMEINKPAKRPEAHIPAKEWQKWKSFHKPD